MGLIADVYYSGQYNESGTFIPRDCTLNGWSAHYSRVCVINAEGPFNPTRDAPAVLLVRHRTMKHVYAVSEEHLKHGLWTMMGGNFLHTSDSRFGLKVRELLGDTTSFVGAVPIHDRYER